MDSERPISTFGQFWKAGDKEDLETACSALVGRLLRSQHLHWVSPEPVSPPRLIRAGPGLLRDIPAFDMKPHIMSLYVGNRLPTGGRERFELAHKGRKQRSHRGAAMMRISTEETRRVIAQSTLPALCRRGNGVATFEEFRRSDTSHQWRRAAPFQPQG